MNVHLPIWMMALLMVATIAIGVGLGLYVVGHWDGPARAQADDSSQNLWEDQRPTPQIRVGRFDRISGLSDAMKVRWLQDTRYGEETVNDLVARVERLSEKTREIGFRVNFGECLELSETATYRLYQDVTLIADGWPSQHFAQWKVDAFLAKAEPENEVARAIATGDIQALYAIASQAREEADK